MKGVNRPVDKVPPYTFSQAKARLTPLLEDLVNKLDSLPADACPNEKAIATVTLNPEYIAKSYYPTELLRSVGLETVGSRGRRITPEQKSKGRTPEEVTTTELFLLGTRSAFRKWANEISSWTENTDALSR